MRRTREEESAERRRYDGDVYYEVWRSGGNPDRVDMDGADEARRTGMYPEDYAQDELRRQRPKRRDDDEEQEG